MRQSKLLLIAICTIFIFSSITAQATIFPNKEYKENKSQYVIGIHHGQILGNLNGGIHGKSDYYNNNVNDWMSKMTSDRSLEIRYSLDKETNEYKEGFLIGYKLAFEEAYTNIFRQTNIDTSIVPNENAVFHGNEIGFELGSMLGEIDFRDNKYNLWEVALPSDLEIIMKYNLMKEAEGYRNGFLAGFKDGFRDGYIEAFQEQNMDFGKEYINYEHISMLGGEINSIDNILKLTIDPGAIYEEKFISVQRQNPPNRFGIHSYIPTTNSYKIHINNKIKTMTLNNPIKLSFTYHGTERGGIYEFANNRWKYLHSNIEDGLISTFIDSKIYGGGIYAVLIDNNYPELRDIHNNWAGKEIDTFIRRGYLAGYPDNTFRPNENISRAEYVILLGRVIGWKNDVNQDEIQIFQDYDEFKGFEDYIAKAISLGLIKGYPDNTFKPKNEITYEEIEWLMRRIYNNDLFKWEDIEEHMLYEKYTRSKSLYGMENPITRAEIVYMLHYLQNMGHI